MTRPARRTLACVAAAGLVFVLVPLLVAGWSGPSNGGEIRVQRATSAAQALTEAAAQAATSWCGTPSETDRTPNAIAGHPIHWIYAVPAGEPDQLAAVAGVMQADADAIDAWWRREDPARTPRNDLARFSCGLQLDVSTLRLSQPGTQIPSGARFATVRDGLREAGFRSELTKYLVYYDGPASDTKICGEGGSDRSGFGLAVVYARACTGVSTAAVAAHELLHTFGAVPFGAPNECPPPEDGHTCDDELDLMYPSIDASPISAKLLDPGRDDYYGHGGSWPDTRTIPWLVYLDRQLQLSLTISGSGIVAADVPGLECAQSCTTTWNGDTRLTLRAAPRPGFKLLGWGGACGGAAACVVTVAQGASVSAVFAPQVYRLRVAVTGQGVVRSSRPDIACRPRCSATFPSHVPLRLTAKPAKGWRLRSWTGACKGAQAVCTVPMTKAASARATFVRA